MNAVHHHEVAHTPAKVAHEPVDHHPLEFPAVRLRRERVSDRVGVGSGSSSASFAGGGPAG